MMLSLSIRTCDVSCLFVLTRLLYGWYWTGELSIRVTLQYVLSNIIISIVPNKHNRWSLITSYCQLETVSDCTKLSVRPILGSENFQNKTNISTFLWMKFLKCQFNLCFFCYPLLDQHKNCFVWTVGFDNIDRGCWMFSMIFSISPPPSLSTLQTPIHPLSLYLD